jgi:hypothetical protein
MRSSSMAMSPEGQLARVLSLMQEGVEEKEIAKQAQFVNVREMAEFMRSQGFRWDMAQSAFVRVEQDRYAKANGGAGYGAGGVAGSGIGNGVSGLVNASGGVSDPDRNEESYVELLSILDRHKDKLIQMVEDAPTLVPRYMLSGISRTKSFHMNHELELLTKEFSKEKNVAQKDIIEVALIDFFKRYGYRNEISRLIGRP